MTGTTDALLGNSGNITLDGLDLLDEGAEELGVTRLLVFGRGITDAVFEDLDAAIKVGIDSFTGDFTTALFFRGRGFSDWFGDDFFDLGSLLGRRLLGGFGDDFFDLGSSLTRRLLSDWFGSRLGSDLLGFRNNFFDLGSRLGGGLLGSRLFFNDSSRLGDDFFLLG